ncbi:hypothetical protein NEOLEDRAFT_158727 [Neolentinus lepideus HHB14362 ss-1]|uniref:Galactose oxidase n=1 Tax=Neolentinus lepideus HHB14362 ss-1 TaxID=1314782 RepID=A0A165TTC5_9AGAM|nr:hypothetical protein NEOLEDRAFT_158727 [Neolentinus lepideus HHB14362 ss-1]
MAAARPIARWTLLSKAIGKARSSHCAAITDNGICLIYGGELKPREPVDTAPLTLSEEQIKVPATNSIPSIKGCVHAFDFGYGIARNAGQTPIDRTDNWQILPPAAGPAPLPRVGATAVWSAKDKHFYMWGGRGGVDMAPVGAEELGVWKGSLTHTNEGGTAQLASIRWEKVTAKNEGEAPESRSYHASVALNGKVYIHAGCPEKGRLSTLYSFDVETLSWKLLAPGPEPGRGGTTLAAASLKEHGDVLLRFGGFAGHELPTDLSLDIYIITEDVWRTVVPVPDPEFRRPGPRSVHGFTSFRSKSPALSDAVAVLYHGEGEASDLGHAGAGNFYNDVWLLLDSAGGLAWKKVSNGESGEAIPEGRGWFPSVSWVKENRETTVVLFGGLLTSNERSDELWALQIE